MNKIYHLLAGLTREEIMGDMMYAGTLGYYGEQQGLLNIMALSNKVGQNIRTGHGIYGYEPKMMYLFGLPWTLSAGGIHVDLADLSASEALNGDYDTNKNYRLQSGMLGSSLEHMVPEQMFNTDPANPVQGVSTMKALQLANQQGQKIYTITQTNADTVLPTLTHSQMTMNDITSAVNAGYTVTAHESPIHVPGWTGSGYIIADQNGNGMYMISGGENGGFLEVINNLALYTSVNSGYFNLLLHTAKTLEPLFNRISAYTTLVSFLTTLPTLYNKCGDSYKYYITAMLSLLFMTIATVLSSYVILALTGFGVILGAILFYALSAIINIILNDIIKGIQGICFVYRKRNWYFA